jgi:hypothetical protein
MWKAGDTIKAGTLLQYGSTLILLLHDVFIQEHDDLPPDHIEKHYIYLSFSEQLMNNIFLGTINSFRAYLTYVTIFS